MSARDTDVTLTSTPRDDTADFRPNPSAGDARIEEDFDTFVRHRSAQLARTAFLLTADRHLAEDLLQTSLAKVADRWTAIVRQGDPTPYVRTVMLRTAISWRRRRWRGEVPTAIVPDVVTHDGVSGLGDDRIRRALLQLAPRQRA